MEIEIFLCGPIGKSCNNYLAFKHYSDLLRQNGITVKNPHEIITGDLVLEEEYVSTLSDALKQEIIWQEAMKLLLPEMWKCKTIVTMSGDWDNDKGAKLLIDVARTLGISVVPLPNFLKQNNIPDKPL